MRRSLQEKGQFKRADTLVIYWSHAARFFLRYKKQIAAKVMAVVPRRPRPLKSLRSSMLVEFLVSSLEVKVLVDPCA